MVAPGMPQQNNGAERRNKILFDMVKSMMSYSLFLWGYATDIAKYILNHIPSKSIPRTPQKGPSTSLVYAFGDVPAHVLKGKMDKLKSKSKVYFIGGYLEKTKGRLCYSKKHTKGWLLYNHEEQTVFVSTNAVLWRMVI